MKKKILIILGASILIGLIFGLSYWLGGKQVKTAFSFLESKVMQNWLATASGKVIGISNHSLTVSNQGDTLTILINEGASIYREIRPEETSELPLPIKKIGFEEIKIGDQVKIPCRLNPGGVLEGVTVTILLE